MKNVLNVSSKKQPTQSIASHGTFGNPAPAFSANMKSPELDLSAK